MAIYSPLSLSQHSGAKDARTPNASRLPCACKLRASVWSACVFSAAFFLCLVAGRGQCQAADDWLMDAWRVEDGLPDNVVDAIAQTPDGYLWVGTQGGLVRFDGVQFTPVDDPEFKIERIRHLYVDRSNRLWVFGERGEVARIHEGQIKTFTAADGMPEHGLQSPTEDFKGRLWCSACADEGIFYSDGDRFVRATSTNSAAGQFGSLSFDSDGVLYGERNGDLWKLHPEEPKPFPALVGNGTQRASVLCPSRRGGFWVIARGECFLVRGGKWERVAQVPYELPAFFETSANYEDNQGRLWFATRQRPKPITISTNGVVEEQNFNTRFGMNCRVLFEDREGNRWWTTTNDGLRRFRPRWIELVSKGDDLPPNAISAVAADPSQGVWAIIGRGLVRIPDDAKTEPHLLDARVPYAKSMWIDSDHTVWVGAEGTGLFRVAGNLVQHLSYNSDNQNLLFAAIFRDADGTLNVGSSDGLYHIEASGGKLILNSEDGSVGHDFRAFAQNKQGQLFAALRDAGLFQRENGKWRRVANDLAGDDLTALYFDANDTLWIGVTGHGLCRIRDGKIFSFQQSRVHLPRNIGGIIEDNRGSLWLTSPEGIFEVRRESLDAIANGKNIEPPVRQFDRSDGMISSQCASGQQPVVTKSADGKLWFAGSRGLYVVDPAKLPRPSAPPETVIEELFLDNQLVWKRPLNSRKRPTEKFQVSPDNAWVEFHFTALSLTRADRNRFRFKLEGLSPDWTDANTTRATYYPRLPPGHYKFRVMACNGDGQWDETGDALAFTVLPYWWQNFWFRSSMVALGALIIIVAYLLRMRSLKTEQRAQRKFSRQLVESQERERQRMSAELHDSLGQSLLVVKNYATMALKESTPPEKMRERLREISEATSASIEEVRSIARALRPYQLDRFGLTKTLEDTAELLAKAGSLRIETDVDNVDQTFSPDAEISIYRIVQEWLNNVAKHSCASVARLHVRKESGLVRMILEDDGVGFDYSEVKNRSNNGAGFGLTNLQERVRLLEGSLKIDTASGKGTRLIVEIPHRK